MVANSPDVNPIENLWANVKQELRETERFFKKKLAEKSPTTDTDFLKKNCPKKSHKLSTIY